MIIDWNGKQYDLDLTDLSVKQCEVIEAETGAPIAEWLDTVSEGFGPKHPEFLKLLKILHWLMLNQSGDPVKIGAVDFPVIKFGKAITAAFATEEPPGEPTPEAAGPTIPAPGTPTSPSPPAPPSPEPAPEEVVGEPVTVS